MAEEKSTPSTTQSSDLQTAVLETEGPDPTRPRPDPLSLLWRVFAAPQTLVVLLGLDALALLLGTIIPQIPAQATDDPQAWLAVQPSIFGQTKGIVYALGLFDVYNTFWFHLLLALTGLAFFVWCVEAASLAWRATVRRAWEPSDFAAWWQETPQIRLSTLDSPQATLVQLHSFLEQQGYRWTDVASLSGPNLVATRRALLLWAEPVVYGALVAVLVGIGIVSNAGWQTQAWQPALGESRAIGYGTAYSVRLDSFELRRDEDGNLRDFRSQVTWLKDGLALSTGVAHGGPSVGIGQPAMRQGIAIRPVGYAPIVRMRGQDDTGRPLLFQADSEELGVSGQVEIAFSPSESQHLVLVLGHDQFLALSFDSTCTESEPALRIELVGPASVDDSHEEDSTAEQQAVTELRDSGLVELENLQLQVDLDYRPILQADRRPGMRLVLTGLLLATIALAASWIVAPRILWLAVGRDGEGSTRIQILSLPGTRGSRWPQRLAGRLQEIVTDDA